MSSPSRPLPEDATPVCHHARLAIYVLAVSLAPALYRASFPPYALHPLAWVSLTPWLVALRVGTPLGVVLVTAVFAFVATYSFVAWLPRAISTYYLQPLAFGHLVLVAIWSVTVLPPLALFALSYRLLSRLPRDSALIVAAAAWVACEFLRASAWPRNPFGIIGYSQASALPIIQIADVTGIYGVSFAIALTNGAVAEFFVLRLRSVGDPRNLTSHLRLPLFVYLCLVTYGAIRLTRYTSAAPSDGFSFPVLLVQGDVVSTSQWRPERREAAYLAYLNLTDAYAPTAQHTIVFWPENAFTFSAQHEPELLAKLAPILRPTESQLVTGGPRLLPGKPSRYFNSAFVISPHSEIEAIYDKQRLLPFAEGFPLGTRTWLRRDFGAVREFTVGPNFRPVPTFAGLAGVLICNEALYSDIARQRANDGADYLVNLANDSWLGDAGFGAEILDMIRLRAVEQRRYVVRVSTYGPSGIVDPAGRLLGGTRSGAAATLRGVIEARREQTTYQSVGDAFAIICVLVALTSVVRVVVGR